MKRLMVRLMVLSGALLPLSAHAADLDGATLSAMWSVPFVGVLLSIAVFPLVAPHVWHRHYGKIAAAWGVAFLVPFAAAFGATAVLASLAHALIAEYLPFILLLTALYTVAGGIWVRGNLHGSPRLNLAILALGTVFASIMGTTGAAMLLIRPLLRANDNRRHVVHVVVFFIFLVANAGGALSPLGDPPLFLGFLNGVDFFWTTVHLALPTVFVCVVLLAVFYAVDSWFFAHRGEERPAALDPSPDSPSPDSQPLAASVANPVADLPADAPADAPGQGIRIEGKVNFVLLGCIVVLVLASGLWKPAAGVDILGTELSLQNGLRDALLVVVTLASLWLTPSATRAGNAFDWAPMAEVAKLFAAIFVTIAPVIAILRAGESGAFAAVVRLVTDGQGQPLNAMYFWGTGILSSFLDNAPTYLVFFNTAGGHAPSLMTTGAGTLAAISAGAVFMGANTYIGNAPNFMVKAIAESRGVRMPSFFGYMLWSGAILLPLFALSTWLFFHN
jgi:Na+/H+ antiporter NhaD/arsenite permease-like protein